MAKATPIQPWKKVCRLRKEILERELKLEDFAVDLYQIVNRKKNGGPFYCDPEQFFATTYATENLRKFCSGILARLAGRSDGLSVLNVAQTFGGGKTHALATVYYLCTLGEKLPKHHPAVAEILAATKMTDPTFARIAAVSFDRVDWKAGGLVKSPNGEARPFRMPWNLIAWQLLGKKGIEILKRDEVGNEILARCNGGLNRQADVQTPVGKGDFAELLRRRMFESFPRGAAECDKHVTAFWHRMQAVEPARAKSPDSKKEMMDAYPFHPDLLNRLFGKWAGLRQFQRTRGILQTVSMALREAEPWDDSPLISSQVFLARPGASDEIGSSLEKLANDAMNSVEETAKPNWPGNLRTDMPRARTAQTNASTLTAREVEAACAAAFIFSQPIGEQAELGELRWLVGATCEIPAMLDAGLLEWAKTSWYLSECESTDPASGLPRYWRMGPKPNLNQMHDSYKRNALKNARAKFNDLVKPASGDQHDRGCGPAKAGCPPIWATCRRRGMVLALPDRRRGRLGGFRRGLVTGKDDTEQGAPGGRPAFSDGGVVALG
jgi:hypothetical protein